MYFKRMCVVAVSLLLLGGALRAESSYSTNFENFALGGDTSHTNPLITDPALTTNNWRGNGASGLADNSVSGSEYDGEIVDTGSPYGKAYRLSNAKVSGNYDQTHAATPTVDMISETGAGGTNGTFSFSFDFKSASESVQDGLILDVTPFLSNSPSRQGILYITDDTTEGFSAWWAQFDNGTYGVVELATNLSRTDWHSVTVDMVIGDEANDDAVTINLNGATTTGLTTWESASFYDSGSPGLDSLIFRASNPIDTTLNTGGVAALDGGGVYFDNLVVTSTEATSAAPVPLPPSAAMMLVGLVGVGGFGWVRRRK